MRRKRDPYTLFLPFDTPEPGVREQQRTLLLVRLGRYLAAGRAAPRHLPLLRLLPSLNNQQVGESSQRFSEEEAAQLLTELGAIIEHNPHYLGRSHYRVTIPIELIERALAAAKITQ
ncbi:MAG: hypothetical protein AB1489_01535 [Acidobacteriota bacterium]